MILESVELEETRTELRQVLVSIYDRVSPPERAVACAERLGQGDCDAELWARISGELGGVGLAVPAALGGSGASLAEAAVLFEVGGARLGCVPLLGSTLAAECLVRSRDAEAARRWVPALSEGRLRGAVAWHGDGVSVRKTAPGQDGDVVLDGTVEIVVDVVDAALLVLPVGVGLVVVDLTSVVVEQVDSLDLTRAVGRVRLSATAGHRVGGRPGAEVLDEVRDVAALFLATEMLGVAEQALADSVDYAKQREQFGRVIGSFQAIKHLLADMATAADLARSLVEHATWAAVERPERLREAASMAFLAAADAACFVTAENVQVHGGIGFSWEHPAHLYFRKARADAALLGDRALMADRLLASVGVLGEA
jgi:alkylation response protein AidB-like acyl-CoA dehydrogenase